jgi:hypothetical protein
MRLTFQRECVDGIPPLAWVAILSRNCATLRLLHGRHVDQLSTGFFEGAWDGTFADADFDKAVNVFGSGAKLESETVTFVSPSHTLEPIYIAQTAELTVVSNSLPFLLQKSHLKFDLWTFHYGDAFSAIVYGLEFTPQTIPLSGGKLTILYHHNAVLAIDGTLTFKPKELPPKFGSYSEYAAYLCDVTGRIFANASDTRRHSQYRPLATISSGYDSAASAAIAKSCGCTEAISLLSSNRGEPDSGRAVAEALGLHHTDFERRPVYSGFAEAEFLATGMQGEDIVYSIFEERLQGRILTTGFAGTIWYKQNPCMANYRRGDISGCSLGEFRLRTNFLHMPLVFIGGLRCLEINKISNSPEMRAYCVGGNHDRPVPRRILEEAGVPRLAFGQAKRGASVLLFQGWNRISRKSSASIADYYKRRRGYTRYLVILCLRIVWWNFGRNLYRLSLKLRQWFRINRQAALPTFLARLCWKLFGIRRPVYGASHPRFTMLLIWAVSQMEERYAAAERKFPASAFVLTASSSGTDDRLALIGRTSTS